MSWHLNIWKIKIWLSQEQKSFWSEKIFLLISQMLSFRHTKQTSKNVADTTSKEAFEKSNKPEDKLFLQDGDPSQNSRKVKWGPKPSMPSWSPDISINKNVFNEIMSEMSERNYIKKILIEINFLKTVKNILLMFKLYISTSWIVKQNNSVHG